MSRKYYQQAFTVVELFVVLALAAIVMTMAVPGFRSVLQNNRVTAQVNDFVSALNLARSEAIKRGTRVTVCKGNDANSDCTTSGGWEDGWIVFADPNNPGQIDNGEEIIRIYEGPLVGDNTLRGNNNVNDRVTFNANGVSAGFNGQVILCDSRGYGERARVTIISNTGRVRTVKATDTDVTLGSCAP